MNLAGDDHLMPRAFEPLPQPAPSRRPPGATRAHHDDGVRFKDRIEYFLRIADQVNVDSGFNGNVFSQRSEPSLGIRERHIGSMERQRVGDNFQNQDTDSGGQSLRESRCCFERIERFRDGGMENSDFKCCLLPDNGPG